MNLSGPISTYVTPIDESIMADKYQQLDRMLHLLIRGRYIDHDKLMTLATCVSGWNILSLPVELLSHILSYIVQDDGEQYISMYYSCTLFSKIMGNPDVIRTNHQAIHPLVPNSIVSDITEYTHAKCKNLILYTRYEYCDNLILETGVNTIPHLYSFLDNVKDNVRDRIIIRTPVDYSGLLDNPSPYIKVLGPRYIDGEFPVDNTYEISIPRSIFLYNNLYPSGRFLRWLIE